MPRSPLVFAHGLALTLGLACAACGARSCGHDDKSAAAATPADGHARPVLNAQGSTRAAGSEPDRTPPPPIQVDAIRALLDRWTATQNDAAFDAYQALYAAKFFGVKRVGTREVRLGRAGWLRDRRRMFQKPTQVEVRDLQVSTNDGYAQVRFTQRWTSGGFEDVGPKQLLVVREAGELRIAQEELLHSDVVSRATAAKRGIDLDFHFLLRLESGVYLVLPEAQLPSELGAYSLEHDPSDPSMYSVSRSVEETSLEPLARAWKGRAVRLEGGCLAHVGDFRVLSRVVPHFGEVQLWNGQTPGEPERPPWNEAQIAKAAFDAQAANVVARLDQPGTCADGRFVRLGGAAEPVVAAQVQDRALAQRARTAFAQLASVRELQESYLRELPGAKGQWWESSLETTIYRHPRSGETLISVKADNGGICGEFSASEWALFELRGSELQRLEPHAVPVAIEQVFDVDGDGRLELLVRGDYGTARELIHPDGARSSLELSYAYRDCPC